MRDDIASVTITCNHPLLRAGVELVDLPGTDDRVAQDNVVKTQLLRMIILQLTIQQPTTEQHLEEFYFMTKT